MATPQPHGELKMKLKDLPEIEQDALHHLIRARGVPPQLIEQVSSVTHVERVCSDAGVYVDFVLAPTTRKLDGSPDFHVADVTAVNIASEHIDFVLYVRGGLLACLEVYGASDKLPSYHGATIRSAE